MTLYVGNILASSGDDPFKFIGGIIVAAIWIIGSIVNAMNKRAEVVKRQQQARRPRDVSFTLPPVSRPQPPAIPAQVANRAAASVRRAAAPRVAAAPVVAQSLSARLSEMPVERSRVARPVASTPASQIGQLLRRQDSLRAAFILNEVMSPPLSMREEGKR